MLPRPLCVVKVSLQSYWLVWRPVLCVFVVASDFTTQRQQVCVSFIFYYAKLIWLEWYFDQTKGRRQHTILYYTKSLLAGHVFYYTTPLEPHHIFAHPVVVTLWPSSGAKGTYFTTQNLCSYVPYSGAKGTYFTTQNLCSYVPYLCASSSSHTWTIQWGQGNRYPRRLDRCLHCSSAPLKHLV